MGNNEKEDNIKDQELSKLLKDLFIFVILSCIFGYIGYIFCAENNYDIKKGIIFAVLFPIGIGCIKEFNYDRPSAYILYIIAYAIMIEYTPIFVGAALILAIIAIFIVRLMKIILKEKSPQYRLIVNMIVIVPIFILASSIIALKENNILINDSTVNELDTKIITETNGTYTGKIINGKKEGNGKYEWYDGSIYEGEFHNDKIEGIGELTIPNKGTYHGVFKNGKKNGEGTYNFANGDMYNGNWKDDKMSGTGTYIFDNGDYYIGDFSNNQFNGEGTYTQGGYNYKGTWSNNEYKK